MSRTYKDVSWKHRKDHYDYKHDTVLVPYTCEDKYEYDWVTDENGKEVFKRVELEIPKTYVLDIRMKTKTTKPKRRKEVDTECHWMTTPSWWNRCFNNVPQRRKGRAWERKVLFEADVEETDPPIFSKKPHKYYW